MLTGMGGGGGGGPPGDTPQVDTAEQIYISSLALLKMLKHGEGLACACRQQGALIWVRGLCRQAQQWAWVKRHRPATLHACCHGSNSISSGASLVQLPADCLFPSFWQPRSTRLPTQLTVMVCLVQQCQRRNPRRCALPAAAPAALQAVLVCPWRSWA